MAGSFIPSTRPSSGTDRPLVYFFCLGNAMRSQMAEGFLRHHGNGRFDVASAGTQPLGYILPEVVQVMRERDVDIRLQRSTGIDPELLHKAEHLIDLSGTLVPHVPEAIASRIIDWDVEDPYGRGLAHLRHTRDQIEHLVLGFLDHGPRPRMPSAREPAVTAKAAPVQEVRLGIRRPPQ